jgi:hypothetical protein
MKLTKILLVVALCASIFSCTQEEDVTTFQDSSVTLKADSLSTCEVAKLSEYCVRLSQTLEFTEMRDKVADFSFKMDYHHDSNWQSRDDIGDWLSNNLNLTHFTSVTEGLDAFDEIGQYTKAFYGGNGSFFASVFTGSPGQIKVILEPITYDPTTTVSTGPCDDYCFGEYDNNLEQAFNGWVSALNFADLMGGGEFWLNDAEFGYRAHVQAADNALWDCLDDCD